MSPPSPSTWPREWAFPLVSIDFGPDMHIDVNASGVLLPNLLNGIAGPYDLVEAMATKMGAERRPRHVIDPVYVLPCERRRDAPTMVFNLGGRGDGKRMQIPLTPFDYIVPNTLNSQPGALNEGETCRLALRPNGPGRGDWLLGSRFLNSHCVSVDYDRRRIAFAKSLRPSKDKA